MLLINNHALPVPAGLTLRQAPPQALRVQAAWRGLTGAQLQGVLGPAQGPFTLTCHDPALNAPRGFAARLLEHKVQAAQDGRWDLDITMEEDNG